VGFKNGTDGNVKIAVDAIKAAQHPHHFLSVTKSGQSAIVSTSGNEDCHMILRGGKAPNYDVESIEAAAKDISGAGLAVNIMVDASHGNSLKKPKNQLQVCEEIARQLGAGDSRIIGVMIESHLIEGRQDLIPGKSLTYGQSITDGCICWDDTVSVLKTLARGVRARRLLEKEC
jgi:3-deoxy-7-phosphoheptulonate synthase